MRFALKWLSGPMANDVGHMLLKVHLKNNFAEVFRCLRDAHYETDRPRKTLVSASGEYIRVPIIPLVSSTL